MKFGMFEIGDRVDHKRLGYVGAVMARYADGNLRVTQTREPINPDELTMVNEKAIQHAFDLGHKAAGGTQIPDNARDMVELALSRDALEEVCDLLEAGMVGWNKNDFPFSIQFLENVSIYRRKP